MAATLREGGIPVQLKRGWLGELRVDVDGRDVFKGDKQSTPDDIVELVRKGIGPEA